MTIIHLLLNFDDLCFLLQPVDLTGDNVTYILYAAHKYEVRGLEQLCTNFLMKNLAASNAFTILNEAVHFGLTDLKNASMKEIEKHAPLIFQSYDDFLNVDAETLKYVLGKDTLSRVREIQLLKVCSSFFQWNSHCWNWPLFLIF